MNSKPIIVASSLAVLCCAFDLAFSDEPDLLLGKKKANRVEVAGAWKMESLRRTDGKVYWGFLQAERKNEIDFAEVKRPRGKPWYLVIHHYRPEAIEKITRLGDKDRKKLLERVGPLMAEQSRARIEAGRMEDTVVEEVERDGQHVFVYTGNWFTLESTADEMATRRCVVRVDQLFRAYRQVLPPRTKPKGALRFVIHGSMDEYRDDLRRRDLQIDNPAFYSVERNLIVAGSELTRFAERLDHVRSLNEDFRKHYETLNKELSSRLNELSNQLKQNGFTDEEIRQEMKIRRGLWKTEFGEVKRKLSEVNRRNDAKFNEVTRQMFKRLYHEAFHAYLENYVFPHKQTKVPRWLNEGLAQIFESSQLDEDTLRIDAPNRELLTQLQTDLTSAHPLTLEEILNSNGDAFLVTHNTATASRRQYLYCWGLAYYLTFKRNLFGGDSLDRYVSIDASADPPVVRFEEIVATRLPEFEQGWRDYMLELKPAPR